MSTVKQSEALELHDKVVEQTKSVLYRWMVVIAVNFLAHFMRMGIALSYMTHELGASELSAGAVVTSHLALIGLANAYLSFSMDTHSFETMITVRFGLLMLATLAEWLAQDFIQFAVAYTFASFSIIWLAVADAYVIQLLPPNQAKLMTTQCSLLIRAGMMTGLALGGCVGGLISMRSVLLYSFVLSVLSLLFILVFVLGREQQLKSAQSEQVMPLYQQFPQLFSDSERFPMPFLHHSEEHESSSQECEEYSLCSFSSMPMLVLILDLGFRTAQTIEIIAWWNVYAMQVMDESIALSNAQMVIGVLFAILSLAVGVRVTHAHLMPLPRLLDYGLVTHTLAGLTTAAMWIIVFPRLRFDHFWLAYPLMYTVDSIPDPFRIPLQVVESPPRKAGSIFAISVLSRSIIPAAQHIIVGALWNRGGPLHPWFFRWFGIVNLMTTVIFLFYWILKKWVLSRIEGSKDFYDVIP